MTSRVALAFALLLVGAITACSGGGSECAPSDVFETEAGPGDSVDTTAEAADGLGETRLLHEEDGYAFFLVDEPELRGEVCVWVERDATYVAHGCSSQGVKMMTGSDGGVGVVYDVRGDVERQALGSYHVVDSCLAVRV
ncbi:hypothetical protein [Cellulosimicrobium sp. NPDC057127]|uniref:hypothetical protein n=1 Tax=Cellulosimicrobium sp. NPDC057127 TaxID=3346026 RepID=UPI0036427C3A